MESFIYKIVTAVLLCTLPLSAQTITFNEIVSSNVGGQSDEDGDYPDWIELFNPTNTPISIADYGLSDDRNEPYKWIFPPATIQPGNHFLVFASGKDKQVWANYGETVITRAEWWKYHIGISEPDAKWRTVDFDDEDWQIGRSGFGYGDNDDATVVDSGTVSIYIRKKFNVTDPNDVFYALLDIDYDDGFVAYLNGREIARANMGPKFEIPSHDDFATNESEALIYRGLRPQQFKIANFRNILLQGDNVLAVQVHNISAESSDLSLIPFLTLGLNSEPENPRGVANIIKPTLPQLHTNFSIRGSGERLFLTNATNEEVDQVRVPTLPPNVSYGRYPDGNSDWFYYTVPSPLLPNSPVNYENISEQPQIVPPAGIFSDPIEVTMIAENQNCSIYYTLDGTVPSDTSSLYSQPIAIDSSTVIRAITLEAQHIPSSIATNSYIFYQTALPIISLSTEPANFFDKETGIYVLGNDYEPDPPNWGANFWEDWEKPVHVEFFEPATPVDPNGKLCFSVDAGVKIFGGWSRAKAQKSLSLFGRTIYGSGDGFNYQIFSDIALNRFEAFVLRNGGNDWAYTMLRDAFITGLVKDSDLDIQAYRPSVMFLNGTYWGIHNIREKFHEHYLAAHYGIDPDSLDIIHLAGGVGLVHGSWDAYNELFDFLNSHNLNDSANYAHVDAQVDVNNFINYNITNIFIGNFDWPGHNNKFYKFYRPGSKWRWMLYDTDAGFGLVDIAQHDHNTLEWATDPNSGAWGNQPHSTLILRKLLENSHFKQMFINRFADYMNVNFDTTNVFQHLDEVSSKIEAEMEHHIERWDHIVGTWHGNLEFLRRFARLRPPHVREHIQTKFNLSGSSEIEIDIVPPGAGNIKINTVAPSEYPWSGIYFNDNPIPIEVFSTRTHEFSHWEGINSSDRKTTVTLNGDIQIKAIFEAFPDTCKPIVISEINYNSSRDFDVEDWIELFAQYGNHDLSRFILRDQNNDNRFIFPEGTTLLQGHYLIVARDTTKFNHLFPDTIPVIGNIEFSFSNGGDQVRLYDFNEVLYDSISFNDSNLWSQESDGTGRTLELINPLLTGNNAADWRSSPLPHGSPGRDNNYHPSSEFGLISPINGRVISKDSTRLWWHSSVDPDSGDSVHYRVEWSANSNFMPYLQEVTPDTSTIINRIAIDSSTNTSGLTDNQTIYWRVFAIDNLGLETASNSNLRGWHFRNELPVEFTVAPTYPNPFNNSFITTFTLPESGEVTFKLFNVLGQHLYDSSSNYPIGSHKLHVKAGDIEHNLANGLYILQISFRDKSEYQKVILLK